MRQILNISSESRWQFLPLEIFNPVANSGWFGLNELGTFAKFRYFATAVTLERDPPARGIAIFLVWQLGFVFPRHLRLSFAPDPHSRVFSPQIRWLTRHPHCARAPARDTYGWSRCAAGRVLVTISRSVTDSGHDNRRMHKIGDRTGSWISADVIHPTQ